MSRANSLSLSALVLAVSVPFAYACGGGKPPETPADESANGDGGEATDKTATDNAASSAAPAASAAADDTSSSAAPAAAATAAPPPAPPALGESDCGKCIDKTCSKQAAACGKNTDCQSTIDGIHACTTAAGGCIANASNPSGAKPKKLAAAYETCAKKAASSKACKAKCQ